MMFELFVSVSLFIDATGLNAFDKLINDVCFLMIIRAILQLTYHGIGSSKSRVIQESNDPRVEMIEVSNDKSETPERKRNTSIHFQILLNN